jgi:DNA polymerase-3 subunit epsilon
MSARTVALDCLPTPALRELVAQHAVAADRRSRRSMVAALAACERLDCAALVAGLPDSVVATICRDLGVPTRGPRRGVHAALAAALGGAVATPTSAPASPPAPAPRPPEDVFVAIDFETASDARDSACAVGLVRVEHGRPVRETYRLIRPPTPQFRFTYIHGIRWSDVAREPDFATVWQDVQPFVAGAPLFAAHNAAFDRSVLNACCTRYGLPAPEARFECTLRLARRTWDLPRFDLATVCRALQIDLDHHHALSDARACASVLLAARSRVSNGAAPKGERS